VSQNEQLSRILSTDLGFRSDTGTILEETLKDKKNTPNIMAININDFIKLLTSPGCEAYTSGISLKTKKADLQNAKSFSNKNDIFDFSNVAIFKGTRMADWLTGDEAQGLLWVKGNGAGTPISVPFGKENISLRIVKVKSNIKPSINKNNANIKINISVVCNLEESQYIRDFLNEDLIKNIEETQNEKIKDEISAAINKSRDKAQDIFGFGKYIYADYPDYYKKNSSSYIHDLNIYINVNTTIRNTRINYKPLIKQ
jgi:spore germination protein KC